MTLNYIAHRDITKMNTITNIILGFLKSVKGFVIFNHGYHSKKDLFAESRNFGNAQQVKYYCHSATIFS